MEPADLVEPAGGVEPADLVEPAGGVEPADLVESADPVVAGELSEPLARPTPELPFPFPLRLLLPLMPPTLVVPAAELAVAGVVFFVGGAGMEGRVDAAAVDVLGPALSRSAMAGA
jgi:hypothetical protein